MNNDTLPPQQFKTCNTCNLEKPISEFYKHRNGTLNVCKPCQRIAVQGYSFKRFGEAGHIYEQKLIDKLKLMGIYAAPGKQSSFRRVDVVAWGCVRMEVKSAVIQNGVYQFNFSNQAGRKELDVDLVVLICAGEPDLYHIFKADQPIFYKNDKVKSGVLYRPNNRFVRHDSNSHQITDVEMEAACDRWDLIEECRLKLVAASFMPANSV